MRRNLQHNEAPPLPPSKASSACRQRTAASARPGCMAGTASIRTRIRNAWAGLCPARAVFVLLTTGLGSGTALAGDTVLVPAGMYQVDHQLQVIVVNLPVETVNAQWPLLKTAVQAGDIYTLQPGVAQVATGMALVAHNPSGVPYQLHFSGLPLIALQAQQAIVDEPRVPGWLVVSDGNGSVLSTQMGIEVRGGFSQSFPKKSYRIECWTDTIGAATIDHSLLGMRLDDDWNLQALYNEPMRARSVVCNKLWRMLHTPWYLPYEPEAVTGVSMAHAEVFVNGAYKGIYALSERIDRKQLKLKKHNGYVRGQLYKGVSWGATTFSSVPPYSNAMRNWGGFELIYPEETTEWADLHALVDFVVNAPEEEFLEGYSTRFDAGNILDYFIFLNLLRAEDNTGKNIYIGLFDAGTPYFYVPHDLDGTFGMRYDGTLYPATQGLLMNGLYERLIEDCRPGGFREQLRARWNALRTGPVTHDFITGLFAQEEARLASNGAYAREALAWNGYAHGTAHAEYLSDWLHARLAWLDSVFNLPCHPAGIAVHARSAISLYPNPATGQVQVKVQAGTAPGRLCLVDATGRTVHEQMLHQERCTVDLHGFRPGLYMVQVHRAGRITTSRLVII